MFVGRLQRFKPIGNTHMFITSKSLRTLSIAAILGISLAACTNQDVGTVSGATVGGLLGSQIGGGSGSILATGVGAIAGAMIGGSIGESMDEQDRRNMQGALNQVPQNRTVGWTNQQGTQYTFTPISPQQTAPSHKRYCREFVQKATINGKETSVYGKACRQPDGTWEVVSSRDN